MAQHSITDTLLAAGAAVHETGARKLATDGAVAAGAFTSPWWGEVVAASYHWIIAAGTVALLAGRLVVVYYDVRKSKAGAKAALSAAARVERTPGEA